MVPSYSRYDDQSNNYHIAGKFARELNLTVTIATVLANLKLNSGNISYLHICILYIWRLRTEPQNFKSTNIFLF